MEIQEGDSRRRFKEIQEGDSLEEIHLNRFKKKFHDS